MAQATDACLGRLATGKAPANWNAMAEAELPSSDALICCYIVLVVGWTDNGTGTHAALEAVERTPLKCCRWLIKGLNGIVTQNTLPATPHPQMVARQSSCREHRWITLYDLFRGL